MKNKKGPFTWFFDYIKTLSMSTQMILTVVLIFLSFFSLQLVLNYYYFQDYYTETEFDNIENDLWVYVNQMNQDNADYYNVMYDFTTKTNAISVITNGELKIFDSFYNEYTILVTDTSTDISYTITVPESLHEYEIGELLSLEGYTSNQNYIVPTTLTSKTNSYSFNSDIDCDDDCTTINDAVVNEIRKPRNLNYQFRTSLLLNEEVDILASGNRNLGDYEYDKDGQSGYTYNTVINNQDVIVFVNNLGQSDFIVTIVPVENTETIISIVSSYNNIVYLLAIIIVFLWSIRLSRVLTNPIQNIESVARHIANLNFDVEAVEENNRENKSLSMSINLIARNLKETLETLGTQNDEVKALYDEQTKQVTLRKQLVSSISHELKTPLMIMQVTIQGILDGIIESDDIGKELNNVLDEINKSSLMISDMLQIYRIDDANTTLELSEFSLATEVSRLISEFEHNIKRHNLKIDLNMDQNAMLEADLKLTRRVISNFFTNALKYTPEGEKIYIEVTQNGYETYFELTNYGVNINEKDLENIWIPFFRTSDYQNNRLPTKGSGIGLYLVSEILKAHNAEYGIENIENGVKAYFTIRKQTLN